MKIIDSHQHCPFKTIKNAKQLIEHLDSLGISQAWLHTWEEKDESLRKTFKRYKYLDLNIEGLEEAWKQYPDRFIPFYAPDPRLGNIIELLHKYQDKGFKGYGELKVRIRYDNPDCLKVFKECGKIGWPVLFHLENPAPGRRWYGGDFEVVENMTRRCPRTTFIGHGPGFWKELPSNEKKWPNKIKTLFLSVPNLYADLSGSAIRALLRQQDKGLNFLTKFQDRLLYGADGVATKLYNHLHQLPLSQQAKEKIFYKNAEGILHAKN